MEDKLIKIDDIYLNSYILSDGINYVSVEIVEDAGRKKVVLLYKDNKKLKDTMQDYKENGHIKKFISNYLKVKTLINRTLRGN